MTHLNTRQLDEANFSWSKNLEAEYLKFFTPSVEREPNGFFKQVSLFDYSGGAYATDSTTTVKDHRAELETGSS